MKRLKFTYIVILIFPIFSFGQSNTINEKVPDFMGARSVSIVEKDTIQKICFCFDQFNKQIYNWGYGNIEKIKSCQVFEKKYIRGSLSYWKYDLFLAKDKDSKKVAEYFNIDNVIWLMKKYENDDIISENNIKVTDSVIDAATFSPRRIIHRDTIPTYRQYMKTEIIN